MPRAWLVAPLLLALLFASRPAAAETACCACLAGTPHNATTSQVPVPADALFCALVVGSEKDFSQNCENAGGNEIICASPPMGNQTCSSVLLADQAVTCPAPAPAPAATDWGLTALALALTGFGIIGLRRRAR